MPSPNLFDVGTDLQPSQGLSVHRRGCSCLLSFSPVIPRRPRTHWGLLVLRFWKLPRLLASLSRLHSLSADSNSYHSLVGVTGPQTGPCCSLPGGASGTAVQAKVDWLASNQILSLTSAEAAAQTSKSQLQTSQGELPEMVKGGDVFPGGSDGKESACNVGDTGLIFGSRGSPGEGNGKKGGERSSK